MKPLIVSLVAVALAASLVAIGCTQAAPAPTQAPAAPTKAPAAAPTKAPAAEPTKAPAAPTKAAAQPTAAPAKKVDFPQKGKTVNLIVPYSAGGGTDVGARLLASVLEKQVGTPFQVVNKPGGGAQVGLTEMVNSNPDGYTLAATNLPTVPSLYLDAERKAAFNRKSFQTVARHVVDPSTLSVLADGPFKSFKDFMDAAKAKPGEIKLGTSGVAGNTHIAGMMLERAAGVKFAFVHFDGGAPAATALLGGNIDAYSDTVGGAPVLQSSGKGRSLVIFDKTRSRLMPNVATAEELMGYKVYLDSSRGWAAPAGTPAEIVAVLEQAIKKAMEDPELNNKLEAQFLEQKYMDSKEFGALWDQVEAQVKELLPMMKAAQK